MDHAALEAFFAEGLSLAEIGRRVGRHESTVAYWARKHGLTATHRVKHAARGPLEREQLRRLVDAGMSISEIADAVDRSTAAVRHWLREYRLKTARAARRSDRAGAGAAITESCPRHGITEFAWRRGGAYRCKRCRAEAVTRRRRKVKRLLVEEAGGACAVCGYDRCIGALEFHHLDPAEKRFSLSHRGVTRSLAAARSEAARCLLLCANCHAEVENGVVDLAAPGSTPYNGRWPRGHRPG